MFTKQSSEEPEEAQPGSAEQQDEEEQEHPEFSEFRNPDGTFKNGSHPWAWQKGHSGNPKGHIPGIPNYSKLSDLMKHLAMQPCTKKKYKKLSWGEAFVKVIFEHALEKGNPTLVKEILDRIDGTVKQVHEVEAQSRTILEFVVAKPPDPAQHEKNKKNGDLNGLTRKEGD